MFFYVLREIIFVVRTDWFFLRAVPNQQWELEARRRGFFTPSLYALEMCVLSNMASTHYRHVGRFLNRLRLCRGYNANIAVSMV